MSNLPKAVSFDFEGRETGDPQWEPLIELPSLKLRLNVKIPTKLLRDHTRNLADSPINIWPILQHEFLSEVCHPDDFEKLFELNLSLGHEIAICQAAHGLLASVGVETPKEVESSKT